MECPQEKSLKSYGLYTWLFTDVERILLANRNKELSAYYILYHLDPILRAHIASMIISLKTKNFAKGKNVTGGFYEEASFIGVVASLIQMSNSNVSRTMRYCIVAKKRLTHFCWA